MGGGELVVVVLKRLKNPWLSSCGRGRKTLLQVWERIIIIIVDWIVDFSFKKMQLKMQYAATWDHNNQNMSPI